LSAALFNCNESDVQVYQHKSDKLQGQRSDSKGQGLTLKAKDSKFVLNGTSKPKTTTLPKH